jgi:hypothetical protein
MFRHTFSLDVEICSLNFIQDFFFSKSLKLLAICFSLLPLAACGPTYLKPLVPNDLPLAPTVIYLPACVAEKSRTLPFQNRPSAEDAAAGLAVCTAFEPILRDGVAKVSGHYVMREAERTSQSYLDIRPDTDVEKAIHARYRVVLDDVRTSRIEVGIQPFTSRLILNYSVKFGIYEIESGKLVGVSALTAGPDAASNLAARLLGGLDGKRCDPINHTSFDAIAGHPQVRCETFSLEAPAP